MRYFILMILAAIAFPLNARSQTVIQMKSEGGVSIIPCKVNGLKLNFIFDTGASNVSISMTEASFMLKNEYLFKEDIIGTSNYLDANGNISAGVNIILKEIEIGGLKLYDVKAAVVANMKAPLLLGQSAISKLGVVQLDLSSNTLTILPKIKTTTLAANQPAADASVDTSSIFALPNTTLYGQALDYFEEASYLEAITSLDLLLKEEPINIKAYILRGLSHDMLEDYKTAIKDYNKVIALDPTNGNAYCYRGKSKFDLFDYNGALADLDRGLKLENKYVQGYLWRADTKKALKNINGAIQDYDKTILLEPTDSSLFLNRAFLKLEIKDYKGAVLDCNKALNINMDYASAFYCRARAKRALMDFAGAMTDLNKALDIDSEYPQVYTERGSIKEHVYEDFEGAMRDYERALEVDSTYLLASLSKRFLEDKIKKNVWIKVTESTSGDVFYIYNSLISNDYLGLKLWVKNTFKTYTIKNNGRPVTITNGYKLWLVRFNCNESGFQLLADKIYDSKGKLVRSNEYTDYGQLETVAPETVLEQVLKESCARYN